MCLNMMLQTTLGLCVFLKIDFLEWVSSTCFFQYQESNLGLLHTVHALLLNWTPRSLGGGVPNICLFNWMCALGEIDSLLPPCGSCNVAW